jgi:hypothetical protein
MATFCLTLAFSDLESMTTTERGALIVDPKKVSLSLAGLSEAQRIYLDRIDRISEI